MKPSRIPAGIIILCAVITAIIYLNGTPFSSGHLSPYNGSYGYAYHPLGKETGPTVIAACTSQGQTRYNCEDNLCVPASGGEYGNIVDCSTNCENNNQCQVLSVQASCTPNAIAPNATSTCTATVDTTGDNCNTGVSWSTDFGSIDENGLYIAPTAQGTANVVAVADQNGMTSEPIQILVENNPPPPPPPSATTTLIVSLDDIGGSAQYSDFSVTVTSNGQTIWSSAPLTQNGEPGGGSFTINQSQSYAVTEVSVSGYTETLGNPGNPCSGTAPSNTSTVYCTISNVSPVISNTFFGFDIGAPRNPWPTQVTPQEGGPVPFSDYRVLGSDNNWYQIETCNGGPNPANPCYNWTNFNSWVSEALANGQDVLYTLFRVPQWANNSSDNAVPPTDLNPDGSGTDQYFKDFVTAVAEHVAENGWHIKYWEVFNEPTVSGEWAGTIPQLVRMTEDARTIVKSYDPAALITSPSPTGVNSVKWMTGPYGQAKDGFIPDGGGQYVDLFAYHTYIFTKGEGCGLEPPNCPDSSLVYESVNAMKSALSTAGYSSVPLISSEGSWGNTTDPTVVMITDPDGQAAFTGSYYILQASAGLGRFYWWGWNFDQGSGWFWNTTTTPLSPPINKAGVAYNQVHSWLVGSTVGTCTEDSNDTWTCPVTRPGGYVGEAIWNSSTNYTCNAYGNVGCPTFTYSLPNGNPYNQYLDLAGDPGIAIEGNEIPVGSKPILLNNQGGNNQPTITLTTTLTINSGTAQYSDFVLAITDNGLLKCGGAAEQTQTCSIGQGDTYTVAEATTTNSANYTISLSNTCSGTAGANPITCSITNTYGSGNTGQPGTYYVDPVNGNDSWSGTLPAPNGNGTDGPFASIAKAQTAVQAAVKGDVAPQVTVMLRNGTYYLPLSPTSPGTLMFSSADSGNANTSVVWENYPEETPVVNGGIPVGNGGLGLQWKRISGNDWQVTIPNSVQPFDSLYDNGQRVTMSRLESNTGIGYYMNNGSCYSAQTGGQVSLSLCSLGTFYRVANTISPTSTLGEGCTYTTNPNDKSQMKCLDRFIYNPNDTVITDWANVNGTSTGVSSAPCSKISGDPYPVGNVEIMMFQSWTVDYMRVACVDTTNDVIYLTGPTGIGEYNLSGPTPGHRYVVMNTLDGFSAAQQEGELGVWFFNYKNDTLNYLTATSGENPNQNTIVIPQLAPINPLGASILSATNLTNVTFSGITFEMDNYTSPAKGFNNDVHGSGYLPEAIDCESCQNVTFDGVTVRHTSTSGLLIASVNGASGPPAENNTIESSTFYDIGAAGIRIGHVWGSTDVVGSVAQSNTVTNNIIQGYSRVFAGGIGIAQSSGHGMTYSYNTIDDGYHAGMSVCELGCNGGAGGDGGDNTAEFNNISDVMQGVTSDSGGLYFNVGNSVGSGSGDVIENNVVHDVVDASANPAGGYGGYGIYLDNQSAGVMVKNNVVYNVTATSLEMSQGPAPGLSADTFENNIAAYGNNGIFDELTSWYPNYAQGVPATTRVHLLSNIFYFDHVPDAGLAFSVIQGCSYSDGLAYGTPTGYQDFEDNLYWDTAESFSTDPDAFHVLTKALKDPRVCASNSPGLTFLNVSQWQSPKAEGSAPSMSEDPGGVIANPGFTGNSSPSDFLLSHNPVTGFNYQETNLTINTAGSSLPPVSPVSPSYPTFTTTF